MDDLENLEGICFESFGLLVILRAIFRLMISTVLMKKLLNVVYEYLQL